MRGLFLEDLLIIRRLKILVQIIVKGRETRYHLLNEKFQIPRKIWKKKKIVTIFCLVTLHGPYWKVRVACETFRMVT